MIVIFAIALGPKCGALKIRTSPHLGGLKTAKVKMKTLMSVIVQSD